MIKPYMYMMHIHPWLNRVIFRLFFFRHLPILTSLQPCRHQLKFLRHLTDSRRQGPGRVTSTLIHTRVNTWVTRGYGGKFKFWTMSIQILASLNLNFEQWAFKFRARGFKFTQNESCSQSYQKEAETNNHRSIHPFSKACYPSQKIIVDFAWIELGDN